MSHQDPVVVTDNSDASRLEIRADGELAELTYRTRAGRLVLIHTTVPDALGGRGLGGLLVQAAIDKALRDDTTLVPLCPFAASWLHRHPDAAAKVTIDWAEPGG
ncbi:MAG: N-acetyltransferase [Actinobacteria bacterium]|nr:N-acetyltransferase [Actinomycetota bacterium]